MEWYDWWRVVNILVCSVSIYLLGKRFYYHSDSWNSKTRDYWYALVMWSITGVVASIEGIVEDLDLGPRLVFVFSASLVTLVGLLKKGVWGGTT